MRAMGTVLLTGAAAIVVWKIMAGVVVGLLGLALKVGLVLLVVFILLKLFNNNSDKRRKSKGTERTQNALDPQGELPEGRSCCPSISPNAGLPRDSRTFAACRSGPVFPARS